MCFHGKYLNLDSSIKKRENVRDVNFKDTNIHLSLVQLYRVSVERAPHRISIKMFPRSYEKVLYVHWAMETDCSLFKETICGYDLFNLKFLLFKLIWIVFWLCYDFRDYFFLIWNAFFFERLRNNTRFLFFIYLIGRLLWIQINEWILLFQQLFI